MPVTPKVMNRWVQDNIKYTIVFSMSVDLPLETLQQLLTTSAITHRDYAKSAITMSNLPEEFYDNYLAMQEALNKQAALMEGVRLEQTKALKDWQQELANTPYDKPPPPAPMNLPRSLVDLLNQRRVLLSGDEMLAHLADGIDPLRLVPQTAADVAALYAPIAEAGTASKPEPPVFTPPEEGTAPPKKKKKAAKA